MKPVPVDVFASPEAFRRGWTRGFYASDARASGTEQLDAILRHGIRSEADLQFLDGYRHGRRERARRLENLVAEMPQTPLPMASSCAA